MKISIGKAFLKSVDKQKKLGEKDPESLCKVDNNQLCTVGQWLINTGVLIFLAEDQLRSDNLSI